MPKVAHMFCKRRSPRPVRRAITAIELVVVIAVLSVLAALAGATRGAIRERSDTDVCLSQLKSLGVAVAMYAEMHNGTLPGPLYPAIYHLGSSPAPTSGVENQLVWKLRTALGAETITDKSVTCPAMQSIVPDDWFDDFYAVTRRPVPPTHYTLNSWDANYFSADDVRDTEPPTYFGFSSSTGEPVPPLAVHRIPRPSQEWMIADAWYRPNSTFPVYPTQAGPYQSAWAGEALPFYAPHMAPNRPLIPLADYQARASECARIRTLRGDGFTNTLFFDGHAASVQSESIAVLTTTYFYGFPGTVNPANAITGHPVWLTLPWP